MEDLRKSLKLVAHENDRLACQAITILEKLGFLYAKVLDEGVPAPEDSWAFFSSVKGRFPNRYLRTQYESFERSGIAEPWYVTHAERRIAVNAARLAPKQQLYTGDDLVGFTRALHGLCGIPTQAKRNRRSRFEAWKENLKQRALERRREFRPEGWASTLKA